MTTKREEWRATNGGMVYDAEDEIVADAHGGSVAERMTRARRIAAVPDYEAALLALLPEGVGMSHDVERHTVACWKTLQGEPCLPECEQARAALRKGGRL